MARQCLALSQAERSGSADAMQPNVLTFIIPVKHPANASDWDQVKSNLAETVRSIARQDGTGWKAIIVANHGAELPDLPKGFEVKRVDFPPNPRYGQGGAEKESRPLAPFQIDKGRRVLAGMLHAGEMGHIMIVDHDDLVSRRLLSFVAANRQSNGWFIHDGLIWNDGSRLLYRFADFSRLCGTSHIVRADLYRLPSSLESADQMYIRRMLGSHISLHADLAAAGTPLVPLPFIGAIYRTAHTESHSQFVGIRKFFLRKQLFIQPWKLCRRLARLRIKTRRLEEEFFGRI